MNHYCCAEFKIPPKEAKSKYFIVSSKWVIDERYSKYSIPETQDDESFINQMLGTHAVAPESWNIYEIQILAKDGNLNTALFNA